MRLLSPHVQRLIGPGHHYPEYDMSANMKLIDLQKRQQEHDKGFHQDIFNISYPDRMNHYVLHFSKYVGRLSKEYSDEKRRTEQLEKTLADSIIVALAAANTLNLDLRKELQDNFEIDSEEAAAIAEDLNQTNEIEDSEEVQYWLFNQMAAPAGRMANAMESLDHMEPMNVRQILEEETVQILSDLLIATDKIGTDLETLLDERWTEIEEESIL